MIFKRTHVYSTATVLIVLFSFVSGIIVPFLAHAEAKCDPDYYASNGITFFSACDEASTNTCSTSTSTSVYKNTDYAGREILTSAQIQAIENNKSFYQKAADTQGIPWQLIAAIHGKESGFSRGGPSNGYGPYQITPSTYPIKDTYTDDEFQNATNRAAEVLKAKAGGKDLSDSSNVKATLFAYNGTASVYIAQAKSLGFNDEEAARGEGSPYVMNRFDKKRDPSVEPTKSNNTWGQIAKEHGAISYPAREGVGTFVYYTALNSSACKSVSAGNVTAKNGNARVIQAAFTSYMNSHNNTYAPLGYILGINGCTTLSSWYINEYTSLTYGRGHGKDVVSNIVSRNPGKLVVTNKPTAPSLFSVSSMNRVWGSSGFPEGHVGLVVSVNEQAQTAVVVHTGKSMANQPEKAFVSEFKYPTNGVSFVYIGEYLK